MFLEFLLHMDVPSAQFLVSMAISLHENRNQHLESAQSEDLVSLAAEKQVSNREALEFFALARVSGNIVKISLLGISLYSLMITPSASSWVIRLPQVTTWQRGKPGYSCSRALQISRYWLNIAPAATAIAIP